MISKEEYRRFINEMTNNDRQNKNLKYMESKYSSMSALLWVFGFMFCVAGFVLSPFFDLYKNFNNTELWIVLVGIGIIMLVIAGTISSQRNQVSGYYKDNYIDLVLSKLLDGYDYKFDKNSQISESIFRRSRFVSKYDRYKGYDKLTVNIPNDDNSKSDTYLTLCDLDVEERVEDPENVRYVSAYKGVFGYIYFPFEFKCVLCLNTKYYKQDVNLEKIVLEDINFHKKFGVYCSDQIEARYILTPEMMEKLMVLSNKFKNIKMVLVDNRMYLGFEGSDLLELGDYKEEIITIFDDLYDDISAVLGLINEIKDNNKIFKM